MTMTLDVAQDELRQKTVSVAKRHKASWIELGQLLYTIHKDKLFKTWGFLAFETYCKKELGIKETTASKLLKSYYFLEKEEPRIVEAKDDEDSEPRTFPNYESVNLLRLAKENKKITPQEYADVRHAVINECREPKEVRAQVKQIVAGGEDPDTPEARNKRRATVVRRLVSFLSNARKELEDDGLLPDYLLKQMSELAAKLEDQLK